MLDVTPAAFYSGLPGCALPRGLGRTREGCAAGGGCPGHGSEHAALTARQTPQLLGREQFGVLDLLDSCDQRCLQAAGLACPEGLETMKLASREGLEDGE